MRGGYRPNAGRPKGSLQKKTIEKKKAEALMKQRILRRLNPLLNSQFALAEGLSFVYKIVESGEGKEKRREHILVEDPEEIKEFLDECEGADGMVEDIYYYITTKAPDNKAIDSMLDRVFDKPKQRTELTGEDGGPIKVETNEITIKHYGEGQTGRK